MPTPSLFDMAPLTQVMEQAAVAPEEPVPAPAPAPAPFVGLTEDDVKRALPAHLRSAVTPQLVDTLNDISSDPVAAENIRNNFVNYTAVLKDGKFKTEDYVNAVAYVSFKLMGYTNKESYARTFPQRYANLIAKGTSDKDISAYVAAYHRGKLVNLIMEQSLVPSWVLNQDIYQKAINVQADLMLNATSEKVRTEAANSILTHLKKPEPKGDFQVNINTAETSGMRELQATLADLARIQREAIAEGNIKTIDVAASRLVQVEGDDE